MSASRADGITIDFETDGPQSGFRIKNPNEPVLKAPPALKQERFNPTSGILDLRRESHEQSRSRNPRSDAAPRVMGGGLAHGM